MTTKPRPLDRSSSGLSPAAEAPRRGRPRQAFVKSLGCQMNLYDSQRMSDVAASEGYRPTGAIEDADLIVLNTCHIRERASEKVFSELGKIRELKERRAAAGLKTTIVLAGCVAQAEGAEILRRQPAVDLVVGPQNYHRLPQLLVEAERAPGIVDADFPVESKFDHLPAPAPKAIRARGPTAFVTVQEGCDKFCSFCVVPYTRGAEWSRPVAEILAEIDLLTGAGVREVTLLGQNVNAYRGLGEDGRPCDLAALIEAAARRPNVLRLRYTTSHPIDMSQSLIRAHRDNAALAPYLHLPAQSGSNRVLAAMNRGHTVDDYLGIVADLRAARPDIALSSDFIVGSPGESEPEFEETLELVRKVGFAASYSFKYSPRPGTPGADMKDQIGERAKAERLALLQGLLEDQRQAFNRRTIGRTMTVLFERRGRHQGQLVGRSPYMQSVIAEGPDSLIGVMVEAAIVDVGPNSLRARIVEAPKVRADLCKETVG